MNVVVAADQFSADNSTPLSRLARLDRSIRAISSIFLEHPFKVDMVGGNLGLQFVSALSVWIKGRLNQ
jgi:hypothetical protein